MHISHLISNYLLNYHLKMIDHTKNKKYSKWTVAPETFETFKSISTIYNAFSAVTNTI